MTTTIKNIGAALGGAVIAIGLILSANMVSAHNDADKTPRAADTTPGTQVFLSADGRVLVRGAQVTATGNDSITARTVWGTTAITWTLATDNDTDFVRKNGKDADEEDVDVGDTISFSGSLNQSTGAFSVATDVVRNWSLTDPDDTTVSAKGKFLD